MKCVCEECNEQFELTADHDSKEQRTAYLEIRSCDSGGIYSITITCPLCGNIHDLR